MTRAPLTDFAAFGHEELVRMLRAGDVASVREAGDAWRRVGRSLVELADAVQTELHRFSPMWRGGAADQYKIMMLEFLEGVDTSAELVASVRDHVHYAADALQRAQREMPAAVAVPELSGVASVVAAGPSTAATTLWDGLTPDQQVTVADELRRHQSCSAAAGAAHSRAVAIMNELAIHYLEVEDSMPALPVAADPPPVPSDTTAATAVETSLGETDDPGTVALTGAAAAGVTLGAPVTGAGLSGQGDESGPSLFGDMYAAGALAASAAVLGRFRLGVNWLQRRRQARSATAGAAAAGGTGGTGGGAGSTAMPGGVGGGGAGSTSVPSGGGGVIGGASVGAPAASPSLTGGGVAGGAGAASGLVPPGSVPVAGTGTGTGTGMGMGMIPPMVPPMGGAEGGGMQRRIPPWLVETEPVFGESVPVTPAVIGAEPEDPRPRRPMA